MNQYTLGALVPFLGNLNIGSGRMVIRVQQGKGGKDRYVMLSVYLLGNLRTY